MVRTSIDINAPLLSPHHSYELPPTIFAQPLPVTKSPKSTTKLSAPSTQKSTLKRKRHHKDPANDDTPRAFARLMAFTQGIKPRPGLDDGIIKSKKQKRQAEPLESTSQPTDPIKDPKIPHIKPGERMSDFAARVDAALPVSGLIGKGGKGLPGVKTSQTKMEKRMQRMQKEWREVEARRKEKLEAAMEEAEDEDEDLKINSRIPKSASSKKGKRRKGSDDEDPWSAVGKSQNAQTTSGGLVGLHDVVQAPPQFSRVPKNKFKIQNGAKIIVSDVPSAAGSLRRREELGETRKSVVEGYRQMMKERNGGVVG